MGADDRHGGLVGQVGRNRVEVAHAVLAEQESARPKARHADGRRLLDDHGRNILLAGVSSFDGPAFAVRRLAAVLPLRAWSGSNRLVDSLPTPDPTIYKRFCVVGPYRLRELLLNPLSLCTLGQQELGIHTQRCRILRHGNETRANLGRDSNLLFQIHFTSVSHVFDEPAARLGSQLFGEL